MTLTNAYPHRLALLQPQPRPLPNPSTDLNPNPEQVRAAGCVPAGGARRQPRLTGSGERACTATALSFLHSHLPCAHLA